MREDIQKKASGEMHRKANQANYTEMERLKPRASAQEAFRRPAYSAVRKSGMEE